MNILKKYSHLITSALVFIVYLTTLAPTVIQIDSGELAAVQSTLGIAHPTGYPLFTMLGHLFSLIPMPFTKIYQLNLLSAIFCSAGVSVFIYTSKLLLDNANKFQTLRKGKTDKKSKQKVKQKNKSNTQSEFDLPESVKYLASVFGGLILAFSQTFWFQSASVEVYSLHILLINLIILFLLKAFLSDSKTAWLIFAFVLALGFTNHMTTILILPGAVYLFFTKRKFDKSSLKLMGKMLIIFIVILIIFYSYLPIIASQNPTLNWGNPVALERIFRHISGAQYQVWLFSSIDSAKKQLIYFFNTIYGEFGVTLFICLLGIFTAFTMSKKIFLFLSITFISTILYSINYDIVDINSYFLLAYISLSFFGIFGALKIILSLRFRKYAYSISVMLISLFIFLEVFFNYKEVDQSRVFTFEDYTKSLINSATKNSIIFSYQWDYFISPSYYFRFVENFRRDAAVIDKELLRRSWYYNQLRGNYPEILSGINNEIKAFKVALKPFESGGNFNPNLLEKLYRNLMSGLVTSNIEERDFYIGPELFRNEMQRGEFTLPEGYRVVPDLFLFKVVKGDGYVPVKISDFSIRFPVNQNRYIKFIKSNVAEMLTRRALYEIQYDKIDRARFYIQKIRNDFPDYTLPKGLERALTK